MITLEPYQEKAIAFLVPRRRAMVESPAGSGKTIIAAFAIRQYLLEADRHDLRCGWVCNTIEQQNQAEAALTLAGIQGCEVACAAAGNDWAHCDILVIDECHHLGADGWRSQVASCRGIIWGFTATPETGNADRDKSLLDFFEMNVITIPRSAVKARVVHAKVQLLDAPVPGLRERIDKEIELELKKRLRWWKRTEQNRWRDVINHRPSDHARHEALAKLKGIEQELWGQVAWQVCVTLGIIGNEKRCELTIQTALRHSSDQVLMLVNQVEHAKELALRIPGAVPTFAGMGRKARREALEGFRAGQVRCLIATSLADEGLDLPNASVLILVSGGRSNAKTEQRTGRVLRAFEEKTHGVIYDFSDSFHPLMAKHARVRQELYRKLGYQIEDKTAPTGRRFL